MIEKIIKEESANLGTPNTFVLGNTSKFENEADDIELMPVVYMSEDIDSTLVKNQAGTVSIEYQLNVFLLDQADYQEQDAEALLDMMGSLEELGIELLGRLNNRREFRQEGLSEMTMTRVHHMLDADLSGVWITFNARIMDAGVMPC